MYITRSSTKSKNINFDWKNYFQKRSTDEILNLIDLKQMFFNLREHLKEEKYLITIVLQRVLSVLLKDLKIEKPSILELGAATGLLTRWLISRYSGIGVLVDNNKTSYQAYKSIRDNLDQSINYLIEDIFTLKLNKLFDIVCSFGLIEHFKEKSNVIDIHKKFVDPKGFILIFVPLDSPLSRSFFEVNPELNLGYRELLKEKEFTDILLQAGLETIRTKKSTGYTYDFIGAICRKK